MPRRPRSPSLPVAVEAPGATTTYHHGDLRRAILDAALALLAEQRHWEFSLREVARRAGVSHNAPYNHFADKQALLVAVATAGFESLREQMEKRSARLSDPAASLVAIGAAYVCFGVGHPAQYRLMFGPALATEAGGLPAALGEAAASAKAVLAGVVLRGAQGDEFTVSASDQAELDLAVLTAWSLVHGLTMLAIDGLTGAAAGHPVATNDLAKRVAHTLLNGLQRR